MNIVQIGRHPVLHSAQSSAISDSMLRMVPHLEDSRNDLEVTARTYSRLHRALAQVAVPVAELNSLLAKKKKEHTAFVEKKLNAAGREDVAACAEVLRVHRARQFRVLICISEDQKEKSATTRYELRRYVVKYDDSSSVSSAQYVMRISYALIHNSESLRRAQGHHIQCSCNATHLEGESGTPFATSMWSLDKNMWETKLIDVYRKPYKLLATVAAMTRESLMRFTPMHKSVSVEKPFDLGMTDEQMLTAIKVQTFGFRWMMSFRPSGNIEPKRDVRELMLLMLYVLYSSKRRFLTKDIGVATNMRVEVDISRRSDKQDGILDYSTSRAAEDLDGDEGTGDSLNTRIFGLFQEQRSNPLSALRIKVNDSRRMPLYTVSFTIPSYKYLKQTYRFTDGLRAPGQERDNIRDVWKEMAQYGIMLGVDAYTGYLRDRRNITTLADLVRFFADVYNRDIQSFCQQILETTYKSLDIEYWTSCRWFNMMTKDATVDDQDVDVWKWLIANQDKTIVDLLIQRRTLGPIARKNGMLMPSREQLKIVRDQLNYWRETYGYDPSYPRGAHMDIIEAWAVPGDPKRFYALKEKGTSLDRKIRMASKIMTEGLGRMLPKMIALPIKPQPKVK